MPHPCVVCGRSRMNPKNREEEYMFFGFPANDESRCLRWLEFCGREDLYKLTKKQLLQRMVCSKHFQPSDFLYVDRLQATAIPSIYDPKQSLYNITCVLCKKMRKDPPSEDYDGTTFHHFPGEEFRCLEWLDFVGDESYYRLTRKEILFCYICSNHFDSSQFVPGFKGRLVDNAVPNIRDPEKSEKKPRPSLAESDVEPTLFANTDKSEEPPLPPEVLESQACAACGRSRADPRNKAERYRFHPFPAYEIGRCLQWCQFLDREDLLKMSPNQIRKLVLCSKHFETSQKFRSPKFRGPCDAIPTIKDVNESSDVVDNQDNNDDDQEIEEEARDNSRVIYRCPRAFVSSKKPKVDNRPTPLAKKRGKSRRPTSINIPKLVPNSLESWGRKLPLPPPTTNWKINLDQIQPITINNVASNVVNSLQGDVKKILLPFTGDITSLGNPIPVNSLASIPPGLLIKINLPEQKQQQQQQLLQQQGRSLLKRKTRQSKKNLTTKSNEQRKTRAKRKTNTSAVSKNAREKKNVEFQMSPKLVDENLAQSLNSDGAKMKEKAISKGNSENNTQVEEDRYLKECKKVKVAINRRKAGCRRVTGTMRRTMIPITGEIGRFFRKLTPLMHRLPTRARATLKLSIVNMVIDKL